MQESFLHGCKDCGKLRAEFGGGGLAQVHSYCSRLKLQDIE